MENIKFTKKINKKDITDDIKIYIAKKVNMKYNLYHLYYLFFH